MTIDERINTGFERLTGALDKLKQKYTRLKSEYEELFEEKQKLHEELHNKNAEIEQLKKDIENLKISNALLIREDSDIDMEDLQDIKHSAKIKLNQIIREIDKAIKILSTNELQ